MKDDSYRLKRISTLGHQLLDVVKSKPITKSEVLADFEIQWLISTPLYNIGEQVNCLSSDFVENYPEIPWSQIAGLRHRLVHDYEGINWTLIAAVLFEELETFIKQIDSLLMD